MVLALVPLQVVQVWLDRTVACGLRPGHAGLEVCRAGQDYSEWVLRSGGPPSELSPAMDRRRAVAPVGGPEMPGTSAPRAEHTCW